MSALDEAATELAAQLTGWGVRTVTDPRDLDLPGGWLAPGTIASTLAGGLAIDWDLYVVAPDSGDPLPALGAALDLLRAHLPIDRLDVLSLAVANQSPDPLPALRLTITTEVETT